MAKWQKVCMKTLTSLRQNRSSRGDRLGMWSMLMWLLPYSLRNSAAVTWGQESIRKVLVNYQDEGRIFVATHDDVSKELSILLHLLLYREKGGGGLLGLSVDGGEEE